jgi:hypothetical protein
MREVFMYKYRVYYKTSAPIRGTEVPPLLEYVREVKGRTKNEAYMNCVYLVNKICIPIRVVRVLDKRK